MAGGYSFDDLTALPWPDGVAVWSLAPRHDRTPCTETVWLLVDGHLHLAVVCRQPSPLPEPVEQPALI